MRLNKKDARLFFMLCWAVYFCSYLGRLNYSAVMGELIGRSLTKSQAGWISTGFLIAYAVGQLVNGLEAENHSPRFMVAIGAIGGGVTNLVFPFTHAFAARIALRFLTGCFMSMIWPAMVHAMVKLLNKDDMVNASVDIASSMAAGTLVSYLMTAFFLKWFSWRLAFFVPGALLGGFGVLWLLAWPMLEGRAHVPEEGQPEAVTAEGHSMPILALITMPCVLATLYPVIMHGVVKDGVTAWVPAYVGEVFGVSASFSALLSVLLPLLNLSGAYMARFIYKYMQSNVFKSSAVFFAAATLGFLLMLLNRSALALTMICFATVTSCMMAVNVLMINLFPLAFERVGRSATVSGALNAIAYGGSSLASGMIGVLSDTWGWGATVASWLTAMLTACVASWLCRRLNIREVEP